MAALIVATDPVKPSVVVLAPLIIKPLRAATFNKPFKSVKVAVTLLEPAEGSTIDISVIKDCAPA